MADIQHAALTGSSLHEPKGASAASAGSVYVANGAASGAWSQRQYTLTAVLADVSSAETVYVPTPYAGNVVKITSVLEGSLTTADATVTASNSAAASMGTLTITQSGSAAGDVDSLAPASNNTVTNDDYITLATDGASGTSRKLWVTLVIERSA